MESAIQFIPVEGKPVHLRTVSEIEGMLSVRIAQEFLKKRKGDGGEYTYVPWEKTLEVLNTIFGVFGWGSNDPLTYYTEGGRTFVVVKSITIAAFDPGSSSVVLVTKTNTGRAVASENARANDTAAAAADSDALSRVAKLLGDALGAFLYDPADPAHQANPTTNSYARSANGNVKYGQQATTQSGTNRRDKPTEKMVASLRDRNNVPESIINRLTFKQAGDMIGAFKGGADLNEALQVAGVRSPIAVSGGQVAVAEDHYLDDDEPDEIPF